MQAFWNLESPKDGGVFTPTCLKACHFSCAKQGLLSVENSGYGSQHHAVVQVLMLGIPVAAAPDSQLTAFSGNCSLLIGWQRKYILVCC